MDTNIEYADQVSNSLQFRDKLTGKIGTFCEKPDPKGTCANCWAETINLKGKPDNKRFGNGLTYDKKNRHRIEVIRHEKELRRLERLNLIKAKSDKFDGHPLIVFCGSTYDWFQPVISDTDRDWFFDRADKLSNLTLLIQSTYVKAMAKYLNKRYPDGLPDHYFIGMSAGTQKFYDQNIYTFAQINARRRYVIFEPILEAINPHLGHSMYGKDIQLDVMGNTLGYRISLFIIGGESGGGARDTNIQWIRDLMNTGVIFGVQVLVKQMGARPYLHSEGSFHHESEKASIHVEKLEVDFTLKYKDRKGGKMQEWQPDLRRREMPL